jgi:hypothetical protein
MTFVLPKLCFWLRHFFSLHQILRRRGDDRTYNRVTVVGAAIIILVAFGLFAATQLGFIPNHAP